MAENNEGFRDQLIILAEIVEQIEKSFVGKDNTDIEIKISDYKFNYLSEQLKNNNKDKVIISIGDCNFIFLRK
jgi:hypothetical protein